MKQKMMCGFTLAELLIVLLIVAALSVGTITGWHKWRQGQRLRETALQLQGFLIRLRAHAAWHNQDFPLWLIPGQRWCLGGGLQPKEGCLPGQRLQLIAPYPDVNLVTLRGEPGFYGRRDMAKAGSILFGYPQEQLRLVISARGRIRLCQIKEESCQ